MSNKIQIGLDTSEVKKSLFEISGIIEKSFSKGKSYDLFTKETKDLLQKEAKKAINDIQKEMEKLVNRTDRYHQILEKVKNSDENTLRVKKKLLEFETQRFKKAEEMSKLEKMQDVLSGKTEMSTSKSAFWGAAAGSVVGNLIIDTLKKFMIPYQQFSASVPQRLSLMGRGINNVSGANDYFTNGLGYSPTEVRDAQQQSIGIFGIGASQTDSPELMRRLRFARATGMDVGQVQGSFSGAAAQGGFNQANRTFEEFRATIFSNKLEHALAPYFESMQSILAQINENGLGLTGEAFRAIAKIAGNGENVSAQTATNLTLGLDQYIKNASGDVQALMMQAYAQKGIGGNTLGGAQAALQYGLFGGGTKAQLEGYRKQGLLTGNDISMITGLGFGGEGASRRRAGAYYDKINQLMGAYKVGPNASMKEREEAWNQQSMILQRATGGKDDTEARMRYNALRMLSTGEKSAAEVKEMWEGEDPTKIMKTSEGYLRSIDAKMAVSLETLGKGIAEPITEIRSIIANLLGGASSIAKVGGNIWHGLTNWGGTNLDPIKGWEQLTNGKTWSEVGGFAKDKLFGTPLNADQQSILSGDIMNQDLAGMTTNRRNQLITEARGELQGIKGQAYDANLAGESTWMYEGKEESINKLINLLIQLNENAANSAKSQAQSAQHLQTMANKSAAPKASKQGSLKTRN